MISHLGTGGNHSWRQVLDFASSILFVGFGTRFSPGILHPDKIWPLIFNNRWSFYLPRKHWNRPESLWGWEWERDWGVRKPRDISSSWTCSPSSPGAQELQIRQIANSNNFSISSLFASEKLAQKNAVKHHSLRGNALNRQNKGLELPTKMPEISKLNLTLALKK